MEPGRLGFGLWRSQRRMAQRTGRRIFAVRCPWGALRRLRSSVCRLLEPAIKLTILVFNEHVDTKVNDPLKPLAIDCYTRWEQLKGKGHNSETHIGHRSQCSTNISLMIGFEDGSVLEKLVAAIAKANQSAHRTDEQIRLFQVPLERMVQPQSTGDKQRVPCPFASSRTTTAATD